MRRVLLLMGGLSGLWGVGLGSNQAFAAEETTEADTQHNTEEPKEAEKGPPLTKPSSGTAERGLSLAAPTGRPKVGDITTSGYFRGGFGASNQKGRQTCFS